MTSPPLSCLNRLPTDPEFEMFRLSVDQRRALVGYIVVREAVGLAVDTVQVPEARVVVRRRLQVERRSILPLRGVFHHVAVERCADLRLQLAFHTPGVIRPGQGAL